MGKIQEFFNEKFGTVRTIVIDDVIYFVASDMAKALGYKNPQKAIRDHCKNNIVYNFATNGGNQNTKIILENDVHLLIQKAKTISENDKYNFEKWLIQLDLVNKKVIIESRKEIEFISSLEDFLEGAGINKGIKQYKVLNYKIDYYIPSINIAIEYDENNHSGYTYEQQEFRQKIIENKLKCNFIRLSDKNTTEYNLGIIAREIFFN